MAEAFLKMAEASAAAPSSNHHRFPANKSRSSEDRNVGNNNRSILPSNKSRIAQDQEGSVRTEGRSSGRDRSKGGKDERRIKSRTKSGESPRTNSKSIPSPSPLMESPRARSKPAGESPGIRPKSMPTPPTESTRSKSKTAPSPRKSEDRKKHSSKKPADGTTSIKKDSSSKTRSRRREPSSKSSSSSSKGGGSNLTASLGGLNDAHVKSNHRKTSVQSVFTKMHDVFEEDVFSIDASDAEASGLHDSFNDSFSEDFSDSGSEFTFDPLATVKPMHVRQSSLDLNTVQKSNSSHSTDAAKSKSDHLRPRNNRKNGIVRSKSADIDIVKIHNTYNEPARKNDALIYSDDEEKSLESSATSLSLSGPKKDTPKGRFRAIPVRSKSDDFDLLTCDPTYKNRRRRQSASKQPLPYNFSDSEGDDDTTDNDNSTNDLQTERLHSSLSNLHASLTNFTNPSRRKKKPQEQPISNISGGSGTSRRNRQVGTRGGASDDEGFSGRESDRSRGASRDPARARTRDRSRDPVRDRSRDPVRDRSRDPGPRDRSRNPVRDRSRDPVRDRSRDPTRGRSRDPTRDRSRDPVRDRSRDPVRDRSRDRSRSPGAAQPAQPAQPARPKRRPSRLSGSASGDESSASGSERLASRDKTMRNKQLLAMFNASDLGLQRPPKETNLHELFNASDLGLGRASRAKNEKPWEKRLGRSFASLNFSDSDND